MNALSIDLRQRILNYSLTHSIRQTVGIFQVSRGTVRRLKNLYYQTGDVAPRPVKAVHWKAISPEGELYLKAYVLEHPDLSLEQLCEHYGLVYGVTPGVATMHNALKRIGITRKKNILRPRQVQRREQGQERQLRQQLKQSGSGRLHVPG